MSLHLPNLQLLRAYAASNVIFIHSIYIILLPNETSVFSDVFKYWGAHGVDIFFVLTGFLMVYTSALKKKGPIEFFVKRVVRLVPLYWLITFGYLAMNFILRIFIEFDTDLELHHSIASFFFLTKLLGDKSPVVFVGWTLEWEMYFYVLLAITLFFKKKLIPNILVFLILCYTAYSYTSYLLLEFVLGMICAELYLSKYKKYVNPNVMLIIGIVTISIELFITTGLDRFIVAGIPSFFVVYGCVACKQVVRNKFFLYLGDASYSLYIVQVFGIFYFIRFARIFPGLVNAELLTMICFVLIMLSGCAIYEWVEKPMTKYFKKNINEKYFPRKPL